MAGLIQRMHQQWRSPQQWLLRWCSWVIIGLAISLGWATGASPTEVPIMPQPAIQNSSQPGVGCDGQLWESGGDRAALQTAIQHSLDYLATPAAATAYANYPVPGVTRDRVRRSLRHFQTLLATTGSAADLQAAVQRDFIWYQAIGHDGQGTVDFTGYFEPTYTASLVPTAEYRYPLYRRPAALDQWPTPHPTRLDLEGADGLQGSAGQLRGLELVWLRDRLEAFLVQVQGSARLQLTNGQTLSVGYDGRTEYPYTSIGRKLVDNGIFTLEELTLPRLIAYFQAHPDQLDQYIPQNNRFVFFRPTDGAPATGSIGVPVTAGRSIATDKSLMPPGAIALIHAPLPEWDGQNWQIRPTSRFVLDQDTGGAIRGAGRVDLFTGTGIQSGQQAGLINSSGALYYLLLP